MFAVILFPLFLITPNLWAEDVESRGDLPGYYEFFMKAGKQVRIESEISRDEKIQTGEIEPVPIGKPLVDVRLPNAVGNTYSPCDYTGEKNLVLVTGRAWW